MSSTRKAPVHRSPACKPHGGDAGVVAAAGVGLAAAVGVAAAVVQLNQIARALRPRADARSRPGETSEAPAPVLREPSVPPMRSPIPPQPKTEERIPAGAAPLQVSLSAIERLRSRLLRGARKAASGDEALRPAPAVEPPASLGYAAGKLTNGATPSSATGVEAAAAPRKARLDFPLRGGPREPDSGDAVWPVRGAPRDPHSNESAEPARAAARSWPPGPSESAVEESQPPAIAKSGVVDGMAYTLYTDGSIEAQLPQGTVRFGSIAELRAHIENNS